MVLEILEQAPVCDGSGGSGGSGVGSFVCFQDGSPKAGLKLDI